MDFEGCWQSCELGGAACGTITTVTSYAIGVSGVYIHLLDEGWLSFSLQWRHALVVPILNFRI